jgi:toxin ParE1/3/4
VVDVFLSPQADIDLEEIWHRIADENPRAADRLLKRISKKIAGLADFPSVGAPRRDLAPAARMLVEGHYVVLYELVRDRVEVVRVLHGARDLPLLYR